MQYMYIIIFTTVKNPRVFKMKRLSWWTASMRCCFCMVWRNSLWYTALLVYPDLPRLRACKCWLAKKIMVKCVGKLKPRGRKNIHLYYLFSKYHKLYLIETSTAILNVILTHFVKSNTVQCWFFLFFICLLVVLNTKMPESQIKLFLWSVRTRHR